MENDLQVKYDSLCYATFLNIKHLTEKADRIAFRNFDYSNDEHKFILSVTMACWNILGERDVAVDGNIFHRRSIAYKYRKICKVGKTTNDEIAVDIDNLLSYMTPPAKEMCGEDFTFADIYREYYDRKDKK